MDSNEFVVQKHWRATLERAEKFLSSTYFTDCNLQGRLYPHRAPLVSLKWYKAGGRTIAFAEAASALEEEEEQDVRGTGVSIGPTWTTHWFRCEMVIPGKWAGRQVRFRWNSSCEAMVWDNGVPLQGLTGMSDRTDYTLTRSAKGGERYVLYVEVAATGLCGAGEGGLINPPDPNLHYPLSTVEIAVFNQDAYDLLMDLTVIIDMAKHLPRDSPRAYEALYTANKMVNTCDPFDSSTFSRCRDLAARFLGEKNGKSQHLVHAMGHCHIDSAWLWPYSETIRKCGRSWASAVRLMEEYPNFTFVCSQAQQLEWVKVHYPTLFGRIKAKAKEGQFIPAGGTWIEMDGNIPSGESFVRQFLIGQRFFKQEFGRYCAEFWLPDTFGYSAQLPQVMRGAGIRYFLTQKLSWNLTNKFPHNSFLWEGIDGTRVLTHFPPADTYGSRANVEDLLKTVKQFKDKGRSRQSILLFGHGDGGGGPTEEMLESLKRVGNVDGLPRVEHSTPERFFASVETESQENSKLCKWVGELYLELHRGTYTTEAKIKQENRHGEFLLHDVDFVTATTFAVKRDLERATALKKAMLPVWKKFLLNQFHDVLPGSCIEKVVEDALAIYEEVSTKANDVLSGELEELLSKLWESCDVKQLTVLNTFAWARKEVVCLPSTGEESTSQGEGWSTEGIQKLHNGKIIALVSAVPMGLKPLEVSKPEQAVSITQEGGGDYVLENMHMRAKLSSEGLLKSVQLKSSHKEAIEPGRVGNQFVLFDDVPLFWDAWDVMEYHLETRKALTGGSCAVVEEGPLRVSLQMKLRISDKSHLTQDIILDADCPFLKFETTVKWHESHKFLKVEFPLNVRAHEARYDIQFGHLARPTHFNTSWDQARFEVCGHKWADLSEHGFGVALMNDCKYGYSTLDSTMRLSLLRSPKAPDAHADMGTHHFTYALMPHGGSLQEAGVIQQAYNLNHPLKLLSTSYTGKSKSFFSVSNPSVILETVKMVENDDASAIVVRLFEAFGSHTETVLTCSLPVKASQRCNLLEEPLGPLALGHQEIAIQFKPFEIVTLLIYFN